MDLLDKINTNNLPKHVAIIMDGNGRWAESKGKPRYLGHQQGVVALKAIVEGAIELGIPYITVYAFSTENWGRPKIEVKALMSLLTRTLHKEAEALAKNGVQLKAIGNLNFLPESAKRGLDKVIQATAHNHKCCLTLAISYGSRWEISETAKKLAILATQGIISPDVINEQVFATHLETSGTPDPELLIRTGGVYRISNYLLWQAAYAELYFSEKLWPDFRKEDLFMAIVDYQLRERRFGMTSKQVQSL